MYQPSSISLRLPRFRRSASSRARCRIFFSLASALVVVGTVPGAGFPAPPAPDGAAAPVTAPVTSSTEAQVDGVPDPGAYFGAEIGAPGVLVPHRRILEYYRVLEERTDRVHLREVGDTTMGRPLYYAVVSSPANLERLDELVADNARLYDPRGVSQEAARRIIDANPTFVVANHQIHSTEVGASQGALLLAHRLATGDDDEVRRILDEVVVVHVPVHNPDGQEMVTEWLARWRGTEFQNAPPPFLYQKYTGHDNNRDWYAFTQVETRLSITEMQNVFHPQLTLDQHQQGSGGSRIFMPPFEDPWEPNVDPVLIASNNMVGTYMGQYLTARGLSGVEWKERYDAWTPARAYYHTHGGVRILTEVASANFADPIEIPFERLPERFRQRHWNFPRPWPGGTWSLADIVDYHYASAMATLSAAADLRRPLLEGMYRAQLRSVDPPEGSPYAFVFPLDQEDPSALARLLEVLRIGDVEVGWAREAFTAAGTRYPAGTPVVRFAQPTGRFARTVLERQDYPRLLQYEDGPLDPPYDVTAHTLPLLMDVEVATVHEPFEADLEVLEAGDEGVGAVEGGVVRPDTGPVAAFLMEPGVTAGFTAAARLAGEGLMRALEPFEAGGKRWPAGTWIVRMPSQSAEVASRLQLVGDVADEAGVRLVGVAELPQVRAGWVAGPSVGIYQSRVPSMPEGWTRYLFDTYEVPFTTLHDAQIRSGRLGAFGVIVVPPVGGRGVGAVRVLLEGWDAAARAAGDEEGDAGPRMPPEYRGGLGEEGVVALRRYVEDGGILLLWDDSTRLATERLGVEVPDVTQGLDATELNIPGSLLRAEVDVEDPLTWGLDPVTPVMFWNSPAWPADRDGGRDGARVLARYPSRDLLMSGWIQGEEHLVGRAALLEIPLGDGRIVMAGFSPEYRGQAHETVKLLFNAGFYPRAEERLGSR